MAGADTGVRVISKTQDSVVFQLGNEKLILPTRWSNGNAQGSLEEFGQVIFKTEAGDYSIDRNTNLSWVNVTMPGKHGDSYWLSSTAQQATDVVILVEKLYNNDLKIDASEFGEISAAFKKLGLVNADAPQPATHNASPARGVSKTS